MRRNILLIGAVISAAGILLILYGTGAGLFTAGAGIANMIIGLATARSTGITVSEPSQRLPRLLVDKGVVKASIYQMAFFDGRLVMKKLASANVTVVLAIILFLAGLTVDGSALIGGLSGGLTGYSLQEYITQGGRDRIRKSNSLNNVESGDLEFEYSKLEKILLRSSSLLIYSPTGALKVSLSRGYVSRMRPVLENVLGEKLEEQATPR